jgi:hypothetical protein
MQSEPEDTILKAMQMKWHELRAAWRDEGFPDTGQARRVFDFHDDKLTAYLWNKVKAMIEADRKAHPKAKRNAPVPPKSPDDVSTRHLP